MDRTDLNSLIIALIYGSLILLSFLKLTNPLKVNKKANFWSAEMKRKIISDEELVRLKSRLTELAELVNITAHQLSYLLNSDFNESFFLFINKYRVEKAKELLLREEMNNLSILGIAFESGFNSNISFNSTFKKITNQTPSEF